MQQQPASRRDVVGLPLRPNEEVSGPPAQSQWSPLPYPSQPFLSREAFLEHMWAQQQQQEAARRHELLNGTASSLPALDANAIPARGTHLRAPDNERTSQTSVMLTRSYPGPTEEPVNAPVLLAICVRLYGISTEIP